MAKNINIMRHLKVESVQDPNGGAAKVTFKFDPLLRIRIKESTDIFKASAISFFIRRIQLYFMQTTGKKLRVSDIYFQGRKNCDDCGMHSACENMAAVTSAMSPEVKKKLAAVEAYWNSTSEGTAKKFEDAIEFVDAVEQSFKDALA